VLARPCNEPFLWDYIHEATSQTKQKWPIVYGLQAMKRKELSEKKSRYKTRPKAERRECSVDGGVKMSTPPSKGGEVRELGNPCSGHDGSFSNQPSTFQGSKKFGKVTTTLNPRGQRQCDHLFILSQGLH
jgi:hypothetical protein